MINQNPNEDINEAPILTIIQQIKDGQLSPLTLKIEERRQCVWVFMSQGYDVHSIAQIFKKCDKTIRRDIDDTREKMILKIDPNFTNYIAGELLTYARIHRDFLMKTARSSNISASEKGQNEYMAFQVFLQAITKLQSLGLLNTQPNAIIGEFFHHKEKDYIDLKNSLNEIETIALETGISREELHKEIKPLKEKIEKKEIEEKINDLNQKIDEKQKKESQDDKSTPDST